MIERRQNIKNKNRCEINKKNKENKENTEKNEKKKVKNDNNIRIKMTDIPICERPYEKFKINGPQSMLDSELIAILLRSGTKNLRVTEIANLVLKDKGLYNLIDMDLESLTKIEGIGMIKALQLKAVCELARRIEKVQRKELLDFSSPDKVASYARCDYRLKTSETLKIFYLNSNLELVFEEEFTSEDSESVVFPLRVIIKHAIANNINSIIAAHNHPTGNLIPSRFDIDATINMIDSLKQVGMTLEDHIIVTESDYLSMRQEKIVNFI